jgi:quercetin dioxygenase-like cupin family protein
MGGLLTIPAGGGAGPDSTPFEKIYVVLEGELTVIINGEETILRTMDSCTIWPNETREIVNRGNHVCKMLVVLPYPPGTKL